MERIQSNPNLNKLESNAYTTVVGRAFSIEWTHPSVLLQRDLFDHRSNLDTKIKILVQLHFL